MAHTLADKSAGASYWKRKIIQTYMITSTAWVTILKKKGQSLWQSIHYIDHNGLGYSLQRKPGSRSAGRTTLFSHTSGSSARNPVDGEEHSTTWRPSWTVLPSPARAESAQPKQKYSAGEQQFWTKPTARIHKVIPPGYILLLGYTLDSLGVHGSYTWWHLSTVKDTLY